MVYILRFTPPDSSRRRWGDPPAPDDGLVQTWDVPGIKINVRNQRAYALKYRAPLR